MQPGLDHIGFVSRSPEQTLGFGFRLGEEVVPGDILLLEGPFGAGKTTFVQGLARGAGTEARVTSPSFTLINEYGGRLPIYHVDLFRLDTLDLEIEQALENCQEGGGVTVVEWPQLIPDDLRVGALRIELQMLGDSDRGIVIHTDGTRWNPDALTGMMQEALRISAGEGSGG